MERYTCEHCNNEISDLTRKLQKHQTSSLWMKHGQCCVACIAPNDIKFIDNNITYEKKRNKPLKEGKKNGNRRDNMIFARDGVSVMEEEARFRIMRQADKSISTGKIIGGTGAAAGLIFLYYEIYIIALAGLLLAIAGIITCRMGVWKKCRKC
ncbi:MAG TPA: hypothetical protein DEQ09_07150 [Bacteroidales bacterium]|nr:hypothetical protein [Bacteroidales bacterium]